MLEGDNCSDPTRLVFIQQMPVAGRERGDIRYTTFKQA